MLVRLLPAPMSAKRERRHWLDVPPRAQVSFAALYLLLQAVIVVLGLCTPDLVFSFQMFNESSIMTIHLSREVRGPDGSTRVEATHGSWSADDGHGQARVHTWAERVPYGAPGTLDRPVAASYGAGAQLFRLQRALDDVARHLDDDRETVALIADVDVSKNGRASTRVRLESRR